MMRRFYCRPLVAGTVAVLLALPLALAAGCTSLRGRVEEVVSSQAVSEDIEYATALKDWTRKGAAYRKLATVLMVTATYHSLPFRRAYVNAYGRAYHLAPGEAEELWSRHRREARAWFEFMAAVYMPEYRWNRLDDPLSPWKLRLYLGDGKALQPADIRRIRTITPLIAACYPYLRPWERLYKIRFPMVEGGNLPPGRVTLEIVGPEGAVRLIWGHPNP